MYGANPGGPAFIVIDSVDGRVMYTKRATGVGSEAIAACHKMATHLADRNGRSYIVYLDLSRRRIGDFVNLQWVRHEGITDEVHPKRNPHRRRRGPDDAVDTAIGSAWHRLMSHVQVSVMDIPRIFRDIKLEMAAGVPLEEAILSVGRQYRVGGRQPNPGLGAAVVGGIAGAVANKVLSNPPIAFKPFSWAVLERIPTESEARYYISKYSRETLAQALEWNDRGNGCWWPDSKAIRECGHPTTLEDARAGMLEVWRGMRPYKGNPSFRRNMPVASVWDRLTDRQRQWALGFAGVSEHQIAYYVPRSWSTLPPKIRESIERGWKENPKDPRDDWHKRMSFDDTLRPYRTAREVAEKLSRRCSLCGASASSKGPYRVPKVGPMKSKPICDQCYRGWRSARRTGETWAENPGRTSRKTTMPIAKFAQLVKNQRDPALWRDFVAKCKAYHSWSHGTWPTKVTVERVAKPGVKGLWITFDMGREPERTYIMPKGTKRKGAWKHPWERMPEMRGDPQAGMIITKLGGKNRLTDFLHG